MGRLQSVIGEVIDITWTTEYYDYDKYPPVCINCGAPEVNPFQENCLCVRALKVHTEKGWWSRCLVCSGGIEDAVYDSECDNPKKGWFLDIVS